MDKKKVVIIATHAGEDPDRATIPFVMANTAVASNMDVTVVLQSVGVMLAVKGYAEHVRAEGFAPLHELIGSLKELGGTLMACTPCLLSRAITEEQLLDGTKTVAAATVIQEAVTADLVLSY